MASLRKIGDKYYSRVTWYNDEKKKNEKTIALKTRLKSEAVIRNNDVTKNEDVIRDGQNLTFPWMNKDGKTELIKVSIKDAYEEYRNVQNIDGVRRSTLVRVDNSMKALYKVFGETYPISSLAYSHIAQFKEVWHKQHAPSTININLSKVRAFHNWCVRRGYAKKKIEFVLVKEDVKPIAYLTEDQFSDIMNCDVIDVHFRKAFLFYYMSGCRKAEPFNATLSGNWLTIDSSTSKGHNNRDVQLTPVMKEIVEEMKNRYQKMIDDFNQKPRHIINRYGKEFKKACRSVGIKGKTLHNLRDTYAVRRWAITGDIKMVSDEIGHSSVVMTEKYAKCKLPRLQDDFPSLRERIALRLIPPTEDSYFTNLLPSV